jgi:hypothetical protein
MGRTGSRDAGSAWLVIGRAFQQLTGSPSGPMIAMLLTEMTAATNDLAPAA